MSDSVGGAKMVLDDVTLTGTAATGGLGAQWNMTNGTGTAARRYRQLAHQRRRQLLRLRLRQRHRPGQHLRRPGHRAQRRRPCDRHRNTFQNIGDTFTANGTQHRGLVIEDAWGTHGASDVTVTGNTFTNITVARRRHCVPALHRRLAANTATSRAPERLDIHGNSFTSLGAGVKSGLSQSGLLRPRRGDCPRASTTSVSSSAPRAPTPSSTPARAPTRSSPAAGNDSITGGAGR
jgi:hypothetical protein